MRALMFALSAVVGLTAGVGSSFSGCSAVDTAFDCHQVCTRYRDCYDKNYDVSACSKRCRDGAADDATKRAQADACEACIGPKSCVSATFQCADSCGSIVTP